MIQISPIQANHPILPSVRILAKEKPRTAATATKTAVQAACEETELSPIEIPSIAEPATKIQSSRSSVKVQKKGSALLTKHKDSREELATNSSK